MADIKEAFENDLIGGDLEVKGKTVLNKTLKAKGHYNFMARHLEADKAYKGKKKSTIYRMER